MLNWRDQGLQFWAVSDIDPADLRAFRRAYEAFVAQRTLALIGASRSGRKFGNVALRELRAHGYRVYPVHPTAETIDGVACRHSMVERPEPVGGVIISLPPEPAVAAVREAVAAGIRRVWLQ